MPHFMIVLITYQFIKPFLDNKMSLFEEYGAFETYILGKILEKYFRMLSDEILSIKKLKLLLI